MSNQYNIYCDESCHLEHDNQKAMVLGAVWCPEDKTHEFNDNIRQIKRDYHLSPQLEIKWTKVSPSRLKFYLALIDFFFQTVDLHFRALIVPDKTLLNHALFPNQDHDVWYYKMYFDMLKAIFDPESQYKVYLDIKDTKGYLKQEKLHEVLCNNQLDFRRQIIQRVQQVRSHEIELLQLADLLIGAVSYVNRELQTSEAKKTIIQRIIEHSKYTLKCSTLLRENKCNIFKWQAGGQANG